jgi:hypothetical protein
LTEELGLVLELPYPSATVFLGYFKYAPPVVIGAFKCSRRHSRSIKRKVNAILVSIGLTMVITTIIYFQNLFYPFIIAITVITFFVSLLSVYGFRASLVSFSGLLAMVIALAIQKKQRMKLWFKFNGVGGLWYLVVSFIFENLLYKRPESVTIRYTSSYW